jgi:cytochrome c2
MKIVFFISLALLALVTLACSLTTPGSGQTVPVEGQPLAELQTKFDKLPAGDPVKGKQLFMAIQPCHICHVDQSVGPAFPGKSPLATVAATRKSGYSTGLYLYESIVNPSAFVVQGFQSDVMPKDFGSKLSQQEQADLIAYLLTMK